MIKIGLLVDCDEIEAWFYKAIERLVESDFVDISLVVKIKNREDSKDYFLYNKLRAFDRKLFKQKPDAEVPVDFSLLLSHIQTIDNINRIKDFKLDLLVYGGNQVLDQNILNSTKYGVWGYHFGDFRSSRGNSNGFWESINNIPETGISLQILNSELGGGQILYESWGLTQQVSPNKNINFLKWLATPFLMRTLKRLHILGKDKFFEEIKKFDKGYEFYNYPLYKKPNNLQTIIPFAKYLYKFSKRMFIKTFFHDEWFLMYCLDPKKSRSLINYKKIVSPKGILWADPHVVQEDDKYFIFVEEMPYKSNKGHLAVIEMNKDGKIKESVKILDRPYHLSYPAIYNIKGKYYMIPESGANRTIEVYESVNFPYEWKFKMNLMENIKSADATILYYNNKYWLFVNIDEDEGSLLYNELFLFYSDDFLTQDWTPHPLNPIVSDVKSSRPAGKIFMENGRLIRPSQNSSVRYGYGTSFNEIIVLNEEQYEEHEVGSILPHWDQSIGGVHTFNSQGDLTLIDAWGLRNKLL